VIGTDTGRVMSEQDKSIREKIIIAAINCIEKDGIQSVTIRGIAKEAMVNSAAINYYFGTKEKLLNEALKRTLDELTGMIGEIIEVKKNNPYEALQEFFKAFIEGMFRWPGIVKAHLYNPYIHNSYQGPFVKQFNTFLNDLMDKIRPLISAENKKELKLSVVQIISALMFSVMLPDLFREFAGIDFHDQARREKYVNHLLKHYLHDPLPPVKSGNSRGGK
jgi:AcrR family transcriptional regulator